MSTDAINSAVAGINVTMAQINLLSQNISNASTPGYTNKTVSQTTDILGNPQLGSVQRAVDTALQASLNGATGTQNQLNVTVNTLSQLETAFGTPAADTSLAAAITNLQTAFQNLSTTPDQAPLESAAVTAAGQVATTLNTYSQTVSTATSSVQTQLQQGLTTVNQTLQSIATLNTEITQAANTQDVTNLQDQRDQAVSTLAGYMNVTTFTKADGALAVYSADGTPLVDAQVGTVGIGGSGGLQVTNPPSGPQAISVSSGTISGLLTMQNTTLPQVQSQLDDIARALTVQFNSINVPLFNDAGTLPLNGAGGLPATTTNPANATQVAGYAGRIAVNQLVSGDPSVLHDGAVAPNLTSAATALAPGDATVINRELAIFSNNSVGFTASTGLPATGSLEGVASDFIASQSNQVANAQTALTSQQALTQTLQSKLSSQTGVSIDSEVAQLEVLQNSYAASARVLTTAIGLFNALITAMG